jgi:hypothetical protein
MMQQYGACEEGGTRVRKPRTQASGAGKKVGEVLVAAGSITPEQLQEASLVQREDPRELGGAAGEIGGILDGVLLRVADQLEKDQELGRKVKSAVTYPVIVLILALLAASFMLIFKVTVFAKMFEDLGPRGDAAASHEGRDGPLGYPHQPLRAPPLPRSRCRRVLVPAVDQDRAGTVWGRVVLRIPAKIGDVVQKVALTRFARTLGTSVPPACQFCRRSR